MGAEADVELGYSIGASVADAVAVAGAGLAIVVAPPIWAASYPCVRLAIGHGADDVGGACTAAKKRDNESKEHVPHEPEDEPVLDICKMSTCSGAAHPFRIAAMKALAVVLLVFAVGGCNRDHVGYVDLDRVSNETDRGKRDSAELKRDLESKQRDIASADAEARKAEETKSTDAKVLRDKATQLVQASQRDYDKHSADVSLLTSVLVAHVVEKLAVERGFTEVRPTKGVVWFAPALDVTGEAIKRINALDVEVEQLKAQVSALQKSKTK